MDVTGEPGSDGSLVIKDVQPPPDKGYGAETIVLLRDRISISPSALDRRLDNINTTLQKPAPTQPDKFYYDLFISGNVPPEEARTKAIELAKKTHLSEISTAKLTDDYIKVLEDPEGNLDNVDMLRDELPLYVQQFEEMCTLLGIDTTLPSKLHTGLTISEGYQLGLTPIPKDLTDLFFDEGVQATAKYQPRWDNPKQKWGSFFPVFVTASSDGQTKIDHSRDTVKIHEDTHFLRAMLVGDEQYSQDMQLAMAGEGLAPIFELWYTGSFKSGSQTPTESALKSIDAGLPPVELRNCEVTCEDPKWWKVAKNQLVITEHSETTNMSASIMKLLKQNPDLNLKDIVQTFLAARTAAEFYQNLFSSGKIVNGFDEFKDNMTNYTSKARNLSFV